MWTRTGRGPPRDCAIHGADARRSMKMLRQLSDDQLQQKCESADGTPMTTWKLLRSMVEHEVHHRGELYALLGVLGVSVPPLYGLTSEQLREIAGRVNSL